MGSGVELAALPLAAEGQKADEHDPPFDDERVFVTNDLHSATEVRYDRIRRFIVSPPWLVVQCLAVTVDLWISTYFRCTIRWSWRSWTQLGVYVLLLADLGLRMNLYGREFFTRLRNLFDVAVVGFSVLYAWSAQRADDRACGRRVEVAGMVLLWRGLTLVRLVLMTWKNVASCSVGLRYLVGAHKARFIDTHHDIDLDLSFISGRLVAMGVPCAGWLGGLFRNPISQVVKYFEIWHPSHYMIINCCPEMYYPPRHFPTGVVRYYDIQDHSPPSLAQALDFLRKASEFYDRHPSNVVAIHCKAGKGRTGSMASVWLLYRGEAATARDATALFALHRTDIDPATGHADEKTQGVETPSQRRFIDGLERLLRAQSLRHPAPLPAVPERPARLTELVLEGFWPKQRAPPRDLVAAVHSGARVRFWSPVAAAGDGVVRFDLAGTLVDGAARISVAVQGDARRRPCAWGAGEGPVERRKAGDEPGCLFYIVIETSFLPDQDLVLPASAVDKACKNRRLYDLSRGSLTLRHSPVPSGPVEAAA